MPAQRRKRLREFAFAAAVLSAFALCCHFWALVRPYYFAVSGTDSDLQMMYFVPFLQKTVLSGHPFWSWSAGLGGDVLGGFSFYYTGSPFFWLSVLLRALHIGRWDLAGGLVWKLTLSLLKQFLSMFFLYILLRREERSHWASLVGAMCYGGTIWFFFSSLSFDFMTDAMLWLPLMLLALRYDRETGNWLPAVLCGAGAILDSFYFAYIGFIFYGVAVLVFLRPAGGTLRTRARSAARALARFLLMAAGSAGLSCVLFLPAVCALRGVDRFYGHAAVAPLFDAQTYLRLPEDLFFCGGVLGFPLVALLVFALPFRKLGSSAKRKTVLAAIFFIMYLIPEFYSLFNGFSYVVNRWLYLLVFAVAWALPDWLDENDRLRRAGVGFFAAVALFAGFCAYTLPARGISIHFHSGKYLFPALTVFAALSLLATLALAARKYANGTRLRKALAAALVVCVALSLVLDVNLYLSARSPNMSASKLSESGRANAEETAIFSALTPKTGDFYRVVFRGSRAENTPLSYGYYGTSFYSSLMDGGQFHWLRNTCDVLCDFVAPNRYENFDDRLFLESLFGVRYIVEQKADGFAPYGYKKSRVTAHYTVYEADHRAGLALWYTSAVNEKTLDRMNPAERDAAMLQTAGVESPVSGLAKGSAAPTVTAVSADFSNASGTGAVLKNGALTVKTGGVLTIPLKNACKGAGELLFTVTLRPLDGKTFSLNVNGSLVKKSAESYPYTYPLDRYTFRLDGKTAALHIRLTPGRYSFAGASVSFSSYASYSAWMKNLDACPLNHLYVNGGTVTANTVCPQKGILALSIPYSSGWHARVDGKPARLFRINGELSGLVLSKGAHSIALHYITPGFLPGLFVTIATAFLASFLFLLRKKRGKSKPPSDTLSRPASIPSEARLG